MPVIFLAQVVVGTVTVIIIKAIQAEAHLAVRPLSAELAHIQEQVIHTQVAAEAAPAPQASQVLIIHITETAELVE
jgi:hypothetical protein